MTKTCPFCNKSKIKVDSKTDNKVKYVGNVKCIRYTASVRCNCCHSRGPTASLVTSYDRLEGWISHLEALQSVEQQAFELWNKRG